MLPSYTESELVKRRRGALSLCVSIHYWLERLRGKCVCVLVRQKNCHEERLGKGLDAEKVCHKGVEVWKLCRGAIAWEKLNRKSEILRDGNKTLSGQISKNKKRRRTTRCEDSDETEMLQICQKNIYITLSVW